jgi:hypothetical protein
MHPGLRDLPRVGADRLFGALAYASDALLAAILAPGCAACSHPIEHPMQGPVCPACWASVEPLRPPLCDRCGAPLPSWRQTDPAEACAACHRQPGPVDRSRSAGRYDDALRQVVHAFKYDGRRTLAGRLGRLMLESGQDVLQDEAWVQSGRGSRTVSGAAGRARTVAMAGDSAAGRSRGRGAEEERAVRVLDLTAALAADATHASSRSHHRPRR